jgi:NitT/TauT family transport system permease protein
LGAVPILGLLLLHLVASELRLAANPNDKLLPGFAQMASAFWDMAANPDPLSGRYLLWADTLASLTRLGLAMAITVAIALVGGLCLGLIPVLRDGFSPLVTFISVIPPIAVLPILFIVFGLGEASKIALIVFGVGCFLLRDLSLYVAGLPQEQLIKAQTLGAGTWLLGLRVALPQMMPRLIDGVRLSLGPAWVFLISAEAIASDVGLGYRIFLVRRYLAMDVIIPYVVWIALLAILMDVALRLVSRWAYPWAHGAR